MENKRSQVAQLKKGDKLSETQYYTVTADPKFGGVQVVNERGLTFTIDDNIVEEGIYSADQFTETQKVSRSELIKIFNNVGDTVFTVNFNKKPDEDDINAALSSINKGKILSNAEIAKAVKEAYKGENRTLTGYLINSDNGFGRSNVIDLNIVNPIDSQYDNRKRQVDHRTLNWLITKNIKYQVK